METSASFEARSAPWFHPAGTGNRPGHPVVPGNGHPYRDQQLGRPEYNPSLPEHSVADSGRVGSRCGRN